MPPAIAFFLRHTIRGFAIALAFVGVILALDLAHLRSLMLNTDLGPMALGLLIFFLGLTFASAQIGFALFSSDAESGSESDTGR
ncbi:MAG: hypothetical protein AAFV62_03290 [Pseudomonadota bacterium]